MRKRRNPCASAAAHVPGIVDDSPALTGETGFRAIRPGIHEDRLHSEKAKAALVDGMTSVSGPRCDEESRVGGNLHDVDDGPITTALLLAARGGSRIAAADGRLPKVPH